MNIFFEIHKDLNREGPGDSQSTRRAISLLKDLPAHPSILDVGCGPGMQTLDLAAYTNGEIIAVDTHQPFLDQLQKRVAIKGLAEHIHLINVSMFDLKFPEQNFDVIWAEGAIYIIGFENGLRTWRQLLKPGGYLAVTEISWLRPDPPGEVKAYWTAEYPGIRTVEENLEILHTNHYHVMGYFSLPPTSWWTDYYTPLEARLPLLREKFRDDPQAPATLDATQKEIDMYRKYSDWYGYVFYVAQAD